MFRRHSLIFSLLIAFTSSQAQQMPECWYRSLAAFEKGEYRVALQYIDSCIIQKEKNYSFWLRKGEIQYQQGDYENALESLLKSDKLKKNSSAFALSKIYCIKGDTTSGFAWLRTYLGQSEKISEGEINLEPTFDKASKSYQWKKIWSKEWYSPLEKLISDAEYGLNNQSWEEVLDLLNPRLKGSKPRPQLLALRARAFHGLGSYRSAIDDFSAAINKSKKNHQYIAQRADVYIAQEKYSSAIKDLTKSIALSGGDPKYYRTRAEAFFKNKQYNQAYDDISYYLSFYPSNSEASFQLVLIAIENGSYVDALFSLGKLIKTNPNEAEYYYYRGVAYIKTENYKVAETDLDIAIKKGYKLSDSYYQRGIARINQNEKDKACRDWEEASKLGNFKAQELLYSKCNKAATIKKW
ncbi:MAG: hypothetical protein EHM93_07755 [Bacteroidales bacterium]|nr:MAG: hypothetical protein EHM93_07755 [Bacteroidales bacterium]